MNRNFLDEARNSKVCGLASDVLDILQIAFYVILAVPILMVMLVIETVVGVASWYRTKRERGK